MIKLNCHHILWQARNYNSGWAKRLREHWYFKKMMPEKTLHKQIHAKINDVPNPGGYACKKAFIALENALNEDLVSDTDTAEERIDFLLSVWEYERYPRTVVALWQQRQIISNFYKKGSK